jgi:hypothetical protein
VRDVGRRRSKGVVDAEQVHVDRPLEDRGIAAGHRRQRGDARICDHDVESAQPLHRGFDSCLDLRAVAHVARHRERITAVGRNLGQKVGLDSGEHDL